MSILDRLETLMTMPTASLGRASRFLLVQVKLWSYCAGLLKENRARQQAAALAYQTIFGLVPMAIVTVMFFQLFSAYREVGAKVKDLVYRQLYLTNIRVPVDANHTQIVTAEPSGSKAGPVSWPDGNAVLPVAPGHQRAGERAMEKADTIPLTSYLDRIIGGFFDGLDKGSITLISTILIVWTAISLLTTVERVFNQTWHAARGRSLVQRVANYWTLLTLGVLLLGAGVYLATQTTAGKAVFDRLQWKGLSDLHRTVLRAILSYVVSVAAFFVLYMLMPNTKVKALAALWGAIVAALVWTAVKWGFAMYVREVVPYSKVYGMIGLVPLAVWWIYWTWLIVLFGSQLAYTTQHLTHLEAARIAAGQKHPDVIIASDVTVLQILKQVGLAFETGQGPVPSDQICRQVGLSPDLAQPLLGLLIEAGVLVKVSEPTAGYALARAPEQIRMSDISLAVAKASFASASMDEVLDSKRLLRTRENLKQLLGEGKA